MIEKIEIRESKPDDVRLLEALYPAAFPDEDLLELVHALLAEPSLVDSYVASVEGEVTGHMILTACGLAGKDAKLCLLGPLAVAPKWQRQGIGSALIRHGVAQQTREGVARIFLLGNPAYYGRFGFKAERDIRPPYPLPDKWRDAWQSLNLSESGDLAGVLSVPTPWAHERYWSS